MRASRICTLALASAMLGAPLLAQAGGDRGAGGTPFGREGFMWQTDIELAKEALKEYEVGLQRMTREEWMGEALAWVAYGFEAESQLLVDDSYRVAGVDPGKRAEVEEGDTEPPTWGIAWGKKRPKELDLILTDNESTVVRCSMGSIEQFESGYLGIFVHEGVILCMPRGSFEEGGGAPS